MINGVEFESDISEYIEKLANEYNNNLSNIADFMLNDESSVYENVYKQELIQALNMPIIRIAEKSYCEISYYNHTLDDVYIISFEVEGVYDKFYYLSING